MPLNKTFLSITLSYRRLENQIIEKRRTPPKENLCGNNYPKQSQKTKYNLGNSIYSSYAGLTTFIYEFLKIDKENQFFFLKFTEKQTHSGSRLCERMFSLTPSESNVGKTVNLFLPLRW